MESLHGVTSEKTSTKTPQPKNFPVDGIVKLGKPMSKELKKEMPSVKKVIVKTPVITETVKRGPGRPRKIESEKINKSKAIIGTKKPMRAKGKR